MYINMQEMSFSGEVEVCLRMQTEMMGHVKVTEQLHSDNLSFEVD